jgi:hypothetical protein
MISDAKFEMFVAVDLDPIKFKLMHESGEGWSPKRTSAVESEYRQFLYLAKAFPHEHLATTEDVDIFWHYHILDTMKYAADCEMLFGYFLHHFPYAGMRGEDDREALDYLGERTALLYQQTFGSTPAAQVKDSATAPCQLVEQAGLTLEIKLTSLSKTAEAAWCLTDAQAARPAGRAAWCLTDAQAARPAGRAAWCLTDGQAARPAGRAAWCLTDAPAARTAGAAWCLTSTQPYGADATRTNRYPTSGQPGSTAWCLTQNQPSRKESSQAAWCLTTRQAGKANAAEAGGRTPGRESAQLAPDSERISALLRRGFSLA